MIALRVATTKRSGPPVFLFVCGDKFGGAEVYLVGLARELVRRGHDVAVVCGPAAAQRLQQSRGAPPVIVDQAVVWDWTEASAVNICRQADFLDRLRQQHERFLPFINLNWLNVGAGLLCALARTPQRAIVHVHLCPHRLQLTGEEHLILAQSLERDIWSVVSADNRRFIAYSLDIDMARAETQIDVIYNGAANIEDTAPGRRGVIRQAARMRLGLAKDSRVVLSVGRHDTQKGFEEALTVMQCLLSALPDVLYVWVGGGDLFDRHREMVHERRLGQHILLFSERPDIADFYRAADLYYTPTKYEGFSLAMLEAGFYGLPAVINDVSSVREYIPAELAVCLVPPLRMWEHVWRLHDLLCGPERRRREIGRILQRQSRRFDRSAMYETMAQRIQETHIA